MPGRVQSSVIMANLKPSPSRPSKFSAGTSQSVKISSAVCKPLMPILSSMLPTTEARKVLLDNESADAACAHRCICERENRIDLRQHAIGDEALRAVEDIFVATAHRYRLH